MRLRNVFSARQRLVVSPAQLTGAVVLANLGAGSACVSCALSNCNRCDSTDICAACNTGFTVSLTTGVGCVTCPSSLNCDRCDTASKCTICKSTFSLLPSTADGCCLASQSWSLTLGAGCVSCSPTNCNRCDSTNVCASCSSGFTLSSTTGIGCVACSANLNCDRCDAAEKCVLCKATFSRLPSTANGSRII